MTPLQQFYKEVEDKMKRAVDTVRREFKEVRGGRATPALVETVTVDYYGAPTPLKQIAAITAPEPRLLVIQAWDDKAIVDIERAILQADIGVTPVVDGKLVRLPIPPLTGERRDELIRVVHKMSEEGKVSIRSIRREANEKMKKLKADNQATEDDVKESQHRIQQITDKSTGEVDTLLKDKERELHTA